MNGINKKKWICIEGSPCYNKDYKFCYYKGKNNNNYGFQNLWYICCVGGRHHTVVFGRGCGPIHYMIDGCLERHYSKIRNVTNTDFKRMFRVVDFDEELHTLSDVENKYPNGIIKGNESNLKTIYLKT